MVHDLNGSLAMIVIRVLSSAGAVPLGMPMEARFGPEGGTLGRSLECTLPLHDPSCHISRRHCRISLGERGFHIRLLSGSLRTLLDGRPMVPDVDMPLQPGATLEIGPYRLGVQDLDAEARVPSRPTRPEPSALDSLVLPARQGLGGAFTELLADTAPQALDLVVGDPTGAGTPRPGLQAPTDDAVLAALYRGLGLPLPAVDVQTQVQQAERAGVLLRAFVQGAMALIESQLVAKEELGLQSMQTGRRRANPLKLSQETSGALELLLGPESRDVAPPLQAVQALFDEWQANDEALRAGLRAALAAALDRLDPRTLELRLAEGGMLEQVLPAQRKARLWERYVERHAALMREAREEFDAALAGAFIRAYESVQRATAEGTRSDRNRR